MMNNSYRYRAEFWECFFPDRSEEIQFWSEIAKKYGRKILAPMSATGEVPIGLARNGFKVQAIDNTPEMIAYGRKRAGEIGSIDFLEGDVRSFSLIETSYDFAFLGTGDFHHFHLKDHQLAVLKNIYEHSRPGSGLGLELFRLPSKSKPNNSGRRRFDPLRPPENLGIQLWKESETQFIPEESFLKISQTMFVLNDNHLETYEYDLQLKLLPREELEELFHQVGYRIVDEFGSYLFEIYTLESSRWIVIAKREQ